MVREKAKADIKWVMAIDIGYKKTGIAVGQMVTKTAQPISIIHRNVRGLSAADFAEIVKQWRVNAIVIGLPTHRDGSAHPLADIIARLGKECALEFLLPVYFIEEYLTSHEAKKRAPQAKYVDAFAAAIIAEDWMENNA